jgi:hypothetical protein
MHPVEAIYKIKEDLMGKPRKKKKVKSEKQIYIFLAAIFLIVAVGTPVLIDILYELGKTVKSPITVVFQANDVMMYTGALLSGLLTIAGVFLTVKYSQKQYKEDMLNRVLPFLTIELISGSFKGDMLNELLAKYKEERILEKNNENKSTSIIEVPISQAIYFRISNEIRVEYSIDDLTKKSYMGGYTIEANGEFSKKISTNNNLYQAFNLINSGNGPAVNFIVTLKHNDMEASSVLFPLHNSQKVYIAFCIDSSAPRGKYTLIYEYSNIYGMEYVKEQTLSIEINGGLIGYEITDKK